MSKTENQKTKVENISKELKQCQISADTHDTKSPGNIVLDDDFKLEILKKWPTLRSKVPPVFLNRCVSLEQHVRKILNNGVKFYPVVNGQNFTKITCQSFNDHKYLVQYLDKKQLPYYTFGNPNKRKMKVVIRGLPNDIDLDKIKLTLKSASIPIIRVHKMHLKEERRDKTMLVLAVVPFDDHGKTILKVTKLLDYDIKLEPPVTKPKQCYRCQKWGHSQRYCHNIIKCVKCGGDHFTKKCEKKLEEPAKCANCKGDHTASCKDCSHLPRSKGHQMLQQLKSYRPGVMPIVTLDDVNRFRNEVKCNKVI